ncbi:hypothetical protein KC361_g14 [Hortaea werneckii]|nr:hypothetical protein KC361_g14 [Hortaea werneckii]
MRFCSICFVLEAPMIMASPFSRLSWLCNRTDNVERIEREPASIELSSSSRWEEFGLNGPVQRIISNNQRSVSTSPGSNKVLLKFTYTPCDPPCTGRSQPSSFETFHQVLTQTFWVVAKLRIPAPRDTFAGSRIYGLGGISIMHPRLFGTYIIPSLPNVIAPKTTFTAVFCVAVIFAIAYSSFFKNEQIR